MILLFVLLVNVWVPRTTALECYNCQNVHDVSLCNSTRICSADQVCYHNQTTTSVQEKVSLGCADFKQCGIHTNVQNTIVGRDLALRQATNCFECCSSDLCSHTLCKHLTPSSCIDDESVDCARMNTLFGICADIDRAKTVCPKFCGLCNVVDGKWSIWSAWSLCDVTCGSGSQLRIRSCNNPAPKHGGHYCSGNYSDSKVCNKDLCPINGGWSEWASWDTCSVSCDMGMQSQVRTCSNPFPSYSGNHCFGDSVNSRLCMPRPCANGEWANWESWGTCTVTCGIGITSRYRSCTNPRPSPYGQYCTGSPTEVKTCSNANCAGTQCDLNPCYHGTCFESNDDFMCICTDGYGGVHCSIPNYYCQSIPCVQGTCVSEQSGYTCHCNQGYVGQSCDVADATDCFDIVRKNISSKSGVYNITLWITNVVKEVYCDMDTHLGGWTVFQHRFNGSVSFDRNFSDYENGFGNLHSEFWLGLKAVQEIAAQGRTELRLDLTAPNDKHAYEVFDNFHLGKAPDYTLHIDHGVGTAGDTYGLSYHNGMKFYTYDHDNTHNCAHNHDGGFWFNNCANVNLNGQFDKSGDHGVLYYDLGGEALSSTKMMMRRF